MIKLLTSIFILILLSSCSNNADKKHNIEHTKQKPSNIMVDIKSDAIKGDVNAQYKLGLSYYNGVGVKQNYNQATYWFRKAADQRDAKAQYALSIMYKEGHGVKHDYKQSVALLRMSASQGYQPAVNMLKHLTSSTKPQ